MLLVGDLERFDRQLIALRVVGRCGVLDGEGIVEVPAQDLLASHVELSDGHLLPDVLAPLHHQLEPVKELGVIGVAPLQRKVAVLDLSRQLEYPALAAALSVVYSVDRGVHAAHLLEARVVDTIDLDAELEGSEIDRLLTRLLCHDCVPFVALE